MNYTLWVCHYSKGLYLCWFLVSVNKRRNMFSQTSQNKSMQIKTW